jgi:hypothetical protein
VVSTEGGSFSSARTVVQLYRDGRDLGQELRLWVARATEEQEPRARQRALAYEESLLGTGCEVYLSYPGDGPSRFYVARADQAAALDLLSEEVASLTGPDQPPQVAVAERWPRCSPVAGAPCLARWGTDGAWYRAAVLNTAPKPGHVQVFFVDYGNSEVVPANQVREGRRSEEMVSLSQKKLVCINRAVV